MLVVLKVLDQELEVEMALHNRKRVVMGAYEIMTLSLLRTVRSRLMNRQKYTRKK